eukprot:7991083-Pyramimonas_sp.AAC.1
MISRAQATRVDIEHEGHGLEPHLSWPPKGITNMAAPSWNHVLLRLQATQVWFERGCPELEQWFLRFLAPHGGI